MVDSRVMSPCVRARIWAFIASVRRCWRLSVEVVDEGV